MNIPGIDFVSNPAPIISSTEYSIKSAMWYYKVKVIDKLSIESTTVEAVTKKVNGGDNGLADRKTIYNKAIEKLGSGLNQISVDLCSRLSVYYINTPFDLAHYQRNYNKISFTSRCLA